MGGKDAKYEKSDAVGMMLEVIDSLNQMKQEFSLVKTKQSYHGKSNANLATNTSVTIDKYKGYFDLTGSLKLPESRSAS